MLGAVDDTSMADGSLHTLPAMGSPILIDRKKNENRSHCNESNVSNEKT